MKILATIFIVAACYTGGLAQSNATLRSQAYEAMLNKDWNGAQQYYQRLYARDSNDVRNRYNYAEASILNLDVDLAIRLFNMVASSDRIKKYPLTYYYLGVSFKHKQKYQEARKWFTKFNRLSLSQKKYGYYKTRSQREPDACDLAQILVNNPIITPPKRADNVNTTASEYAPLEFDSVLYFSTMREPAKKEPGKTVNSRIYRLPLKGKKKPALLDTLINANLTHQANTCITRDKKHMIFSRCISKNAADYNCELYTSSFFNNKWHEGMRLDEINETGFSTTHPALGMIDSAEVLFVSSNRPGGEGGMDIWYSIVRPDGSYDSLVNAGKSINTPDDEITPWFHNGSIYFSSTWHHGLGGFDIFRSEITGKNFGAPVNLGYPINSSYNDLYYSTGANGSVYLSSNRAGSMFEKKLNCCSDIYKFSTDTIKPVVIDSNKIVKEKMKLLVPLTLYFHNDQPDPATKNTTTSKNYETTYNEYKALQTQYSAEYSKGIKDKKESEKEIGLFFTDSLENGMDALRKFADLLGKTLKNGETVRIIMKGYCSPLASTDYNINLAKRRISSLRNYFMETHGGLFSHYVNNPNANEGKIIFEDVDIGELPVSKASDDLKDKRNSVYSPHAASERKIQIIAVSFGK